jgi:hypothetical protein
MKNSHLNVMETSTPLLTTLYETVTTILSFQESSVNVSTSRGQQVGLLFKSTGLGIKVVGKLFPRRRKA